MTSEGELGRVLNALSATLNDQRRERFDPESVEQICTQALGGEHLLRAEADPAHIDAGRLVDASGTRVAEVRRREGTWEVERIVSATSETYLPSPPHAKDKARMQAKKGRMPLIGAAAFAVIVFVVMLVVLGITLWICIVAGLAVLLVGGAGGMMGKQMLSE